MSKEFERPPVPKKKHHLREVTDADTVTAVERNEWAGPIGGKLKDGRTMVDPRLQKPLKSSEHV